MITPSSTNPAVTEKGDYIFRMCFVDPYQGEAMAKYLIGTGVKKAAILIDVKSDYSTGLAKFFRETFVANGGTIVTTGSYSKGDNDFRAQLNSIKATKPEVIFVPGYYNDIGQIAIQAREIGITQPLVGGDGWESPKLLEPHIKVGKLRALAVRSTARLEELPDTPTLDELGYKGFGPYVWTGTFVRTGTPTAIVNKLNDAFAKALANPNVIAKLKVLGATPLNIGPDKFPAMVKQDSAHWAAAIHKLNLPKE